MSKILNVYRITTDSTPTADDVCVVAFNHLTTANEIHTSVIIGEVVTPVIRPSYNSQNAPSHFITTAGDLDKGVYECIVKPGAVIAVNKNTGEEISIGEYEKRKSALIDELQTAGVLDTDADDQYPPRVVDGLDLIGILSGMNDRDRNSLSDKLAQYKKCQSDWSTKSTTPTTIVGDKYGINFVATRRLIDSPRKFIGVGGSSIRSFVDGRLIIDSIISGNISYVYHRDKHFADIVATWLDGLSDEERTKIGFKYAGQHSDISSIQFAKYTKPSGEEVYVRWNVAETVFKHPTLSASAVSLIEEYDMFEKTVLGSLNAIRLECCGDVDARTIGQLIEIYRKLPSVLSSLGTVSTRSNASEIALNQVCVELRKMIKSVESVFDEVQKSSQ